MRAATMRRWALLAPCYIRCSEERFFQLAAKAMAQTWPVSRKRRALHWFFVDAIQRATELLQSRCVKKSRSPVKSSYGSPIIGSASAAHAQSCLVDRFIAASIRPVTRLKF